MTRLRWRAVCHDCPWTSTKSVHQHWADHERHAHFQQFPNHDVHVAHEEAL